jgi:hypothetical protein
VNRLPDDLARLGADLEAATAAAAARRRRRRAWFHGVGASMLAAPLAAVMVAAPLEPSNAIPVKARPLQTALQPPTFAFMVRHIPDERVPLAVAGACLAAEDCRTPVAPSLTPAPPGRV